MWLFQLIQERKEVVWTTNNSAIAAYLQVATSYNLISGKTDGGIGPVSRQGIYIHLNWDVAVGVGDGTEKNIGLVNLKQLIQIIDGS
jgi:hypothetical protein